MGLSARTAAGRAAAAATAHPATGIAAKPPPTSRIKSNDGVCFFAFCQKTFAFFVQVCYTVRVFGNKPYAIVAQLDRAFGSDNCDRAGFWLAFVRYSVICTCKNAVVNGSQTTN